MIAMARKYSSSRVLSVSLAYRRVIQKPQEAQEVYQSRSRGCDFRSPILLAFDKGLQIISDDFFQSALAQTGIKSEEEFNGFKRITKVIRLVVQTPLVAHVALDALLLWKILLRELLKDWVDHTRFMLICSLSCSRIDTCSIADLERVISPPFPLRKAG